MKIEKTFTIRAPASAVWAFLTDPRRVARALPGAAITEEIDPATYGGTITVKVGPISTSYRGKMHFERLDQQSGTAEIVASGQDVRGKGGAQMRMTSHVSERTAGETEVNVESDVTITGLLAQMGRGMIDDVSNQMFDRFSGAMRTELEPSPSAGEAPGAGAQVGGGAERGGTAPTPSREPSRPANGAPLGGASLQSSSGAAAGAAAPPIEVVSFGGKVVLRALRRTARRPGFWVAVVLLLVVLYWVWLR
jgi:carbon monoxide dehydrogenase subunit G